MIEQNSSGCTLVIARSSAGTRTLWPTVCPPSLTSLRAPAAADRLSTVKNCDQILCMQKGHVLERGTHAELLKIPIKKADDGERMVSGLYHDLWQTQMGSDADESSAIGHG